MSAKSDYLENKLIDLVFRGVSYAGPTHIYLALFTATPSDSGGGTEVTGGSYARSQLDPSTTNWAATNSAGSTAGTSSGTSGTTSNNSPITFPTATGNWGTITSVGIFDASVGGNLLWWGPLTSNQTVNSGGTFSFAAGALTIQDDN
jgi:hypothetical protein